MNTHDRAFVDEQRLRNLEAALAHHQRDFEQVNQVVIELGRNLEQLARRMARMELALQRIAEQLPETSRDADHERPPHY